MLKKKLKLLIIASLLALFACSSPSVESKIENLIETYSTETFHTYTHKGKIIKPKDASELAPKLYNCLSNHRDADLILHTDFGELQHTKRELKNILSAAHYYCDDFEKKSSIVKLHEK